jgi:hypothetical protein
MTKTPCRALLVGIFLLAGGCASSEKGTKSINAPHPASPETVQSIRDAYFRAYPMSRVGVIIATRPKDRLVAVGDINPSEFAIGQEVYFLDSKRQVLTTGRIVRILANSIHAQYDPPPDHARAPATGDIMVRLPLGAAPL